MVNQLSAAAASASSTAAAASSSSTTAAATAAFMNLKFGGFSATSASDRQEKTGSGSGPTQSSSTGASNGVGPIEDIIKEEDGQLSLDAAERMLRWHAESVGRCVELSAQGDM